MLKKLLIAAGVVLSVAAVSQWKSIDSQINAYCGNLSCPHCQGKIEDKLKGQSSDGFAVHVPTCSKCGAEVVGR